MLSKIFFLKKIVTSLGAADVSAKVIGIGCFDLSVSVTQGAVTISSAMLESTRLLSTTVVKNRELFSAVIVENCEILSKTVENNREIALSSLENTKTQVKAEIPEVMDKFVSQQKLKAFDEIKQTPPVSTCISAYKFIKVPIDEINVGISNITGSYTTFVGGDLQIFLLIFYQQKWI